MLEYFEYFVVKPISGTIPKLFLSGDFVGTQPANIGEGSILEGSEAPVNCLWADDYVTYSIIDEMLPLTKQYDGME